MQVERESYRIDPRPVHRGALGSPGVDSPIVRSLGRAEYVPTWQAMQTFTAQRTANTADELWLLEHPPVYTVGVAGRLEHLPHAATSVPVVKIDRGG